MKLYLRKSTELKDLFIALKSHILTLNRDFNYRIEVIKIDNDCTLQQKRALFGVAYKILRESTGNEIESLHEYFCGEWFGWKKEIVFGREQQKPMRTLTRDYDGKKSPIDTKSFMDFYLFLQERAARIDVMIPEPFPNQ